MSYRIIWTTPVVPGAEKELPDAREWDSRDMAQLAASLCPCTHSGKYRNFRIEEIQRGKAIRK